MSLFFSSLNLFALTLYIHRGRKEAKSAQGLCPWTPENGQRTPAWGLQFQPAALFVLGGAAPVRLC